MGRRGACPAAFAVAWCMADVQEGMDSALTCGSISDGMSNMSNIQHLHLQPRTCSAACSSKISSAHMSHDMFHDMFSRHVFTTCFTTCFTCQCRHFQRHASRHVARTGNGIFRDIFHDMFHASVTAFSETCFTISSATDVHRHWRPWQMYHGVVGDNLYPLDMDMTHAPVPVSPAPPSYSPAHRSPAPAIASTPP